ncbi:5'-methylthioadenosine/adenosylhomocysteine nucleosidase [Hugenholtzia roseola]|uniref:5'-methylthioadenosine/adenosylhomocysteine nucleosidase n=1 Tax=Hugenholtzia roseola TaxID=1002 RepID=UPI00047B643A|nr:5'-methylthioadenosine/adenosylhomocysteine nucleosidase [Hugenholtzia roseola]
MKHLSPFCLPFLSLLLLFFWVEKNSLLAQEKNPTAQPVAIIGAMDAEIEQFRSYLKNAKSTQLLGVTFYQGSIEDQPVVLVKSGIGKVNAALTTALLLQNFKPSAVIFTGIAGGIGENLLPGDIVISTQTAQHDFGQLSSEGISVWQTFNREEKSNPLFFPCDSALVSLAEQAAAQAQLRLVRTYDAKRKPSINKGTIVTGDVFMASSQGKAKLIKDFNAAAVEMEGGAVAQICFQEKIPYLVIRSISDTADEDAERFYKKFIKVAAFNSASLVIEMLKLME